ncbi:hypothetical protein ACE193_23245 [Bernardetia sp. OM2101]|uniref:hypothetical protein n=1 Tax=Bernardetia sp. OM2101 TaxID=3344876 RepID=UPI0035D03AEB
MAEIKIEKKTPIIPWLLGLLLLLAVSTGVYFAFFYGNKAEQEAIANEITMNENEIVPDEVVVVETEMIPAEVNTFIAFANENREYEATQMDVHHEYTANALRHMGDALEVIAIKRGMADQMNVQDLHKKLDTAADEIQKNWKETDHADHIRNAFLQVSGALNQLADGSMNESLKKEAKDIDPNTLTLEQKADVQDFIDKTASVMKQLAME